MMGVYGGSVRPACVVSRVQMFILGPSWIQSAQPRFATKQLDARGTVGQQLSPTYLLEAIRAPAWRARTISLLRCPFAGDVASWEDQLLPCEVENTPATLSGTLTINKGFYGVGPLLSCGWPVLLSSSPLSAVSLVQHWTVIAFQGLPLGVRALASRLPHHAATRRPVIHYLLSDTSYFNKCSITT